MEKTTHLIEEYKVAEDTIECCCGWKNYSDLFKLHQELSFPTDKKPSPDRFAMDAFNGGVATQDKGITWLVKDSHPDLFDYVDDKKHEEVPEIFARAPIESEDF